MKSSHFALLLLFPPFKTPRFHTFLAQTWVQLYGSKLRDGHLILRCDESVISVVLLKSFNLILPPTILCPIGLLECMMGSSS